MKISEWISLHPGRAITVPPNCSLNDAMVRMLAEECMRDLYVISCDEHLIGHLSHKKLVNLLLTEHQPVHTRRQLIMRIAGGSAQELMVTEFTFARPDEELDNVLHWQLEHDVEDMPVINEDGILVGVINLRVVLQEMIQDNNQEVS
jgi:CBS-domain-containing membrane protein